MEKKYKIMKNILGEYGVFKRAMKAVGCIGSSREIGRAHV